MAGRRRGVHVVGRPELLRLDWLIFLVGIDAMVDAFRVRTGARWNFVILLVLVPAYTVAAVVVRARAGDATLASVAQVLIGMVALAVAIVVHHGAVRSGKFLYAAGDGLSGTSVLEH